MGYTTHFELSISPTSKATEVLDWLRENEDKSEYWVAVETIEEVGEPRKWYGHEQDMLHISLEFPDVLFTLKGEGEEPGDIWIKYFKDGKIQRCHAKITFDKYNESRLGE